MPRRHRPRVRIGAQVGYRDLTGFGRRYIDISAEDLTADVMHQIDALQALAHAAESVVSYAKPHGALYNTVATHEEQARAVTLAIHAVNPALPVLGLAGVGDGSMPQANWVCAVSLKCSRTVRIVLTVNLCRAANPVR